MRKNDQKILNCQAFSLVELAVASVIFVLVGMGIFVSLSVVKQRNSSVYKNVQGAYYGQQALENLRASVDARTWDLPNQALSLGSHQIEAKRINDTNYRVDYTVTQDANGARHVQLTVSW